MKTRSLRPDPTDSQFTAKVTQTLQEKTMSKTTAAISTVLLMLGSTSAFSQANLGKPDRSIL